MQPINTNVESVYSGDQLRDECTFTAHNPNSIKYGLPGTFRCNNSTRNAIPGGIPIDETILSRHMLLLGGIGSGKTNAFNFIIKNTLENLTNNDVVIIFDTKGDYLKEFYKPGNIVISNDINTATDGYKKNFWNIFNEVMIDDRVEENIQEIAESLFAEKIYHTTQPFFPTAAKDLFSALMIHIVRSNRLKDFRNNHYLRTQINRCTPEMMTAILKQHPDLTAMNSYIADPKSGQTLGVMAELQQTAREVFTGCFAQRGDLSIRQIIKNKGKKVVFIEYDLSLGSTLIPIYRLLIDLAIKQALCRKEQEGNVFFFLDEFRLLPLLNHMDDGVNFGRSLGAKFVIGIQNIDQVLAAYGEHEGRSILSGFGTTFAFKVNDFGSRTYIKDLFGKNIKKRSFQQTVQSRGMSEQLTQGNVVEDKDINGLQIGECIVRVPSGEPFRFRFNEYR